MDPMLNPDDAQLVAQFVAGTANHLNKIDREVTSTSPNVKALQFDPRAAIKSVANQVRNQLAPGSAPTGAPALHTIPMAPVEPVEFTTMPTQHVPQSQPAAERGPAPNFQSQPHPTSYGAPPQVVIMDVKTVQEFRDEIEMLKVTQQELIKHIVLLRSLEEKFMEVLEKGLKKGPSSITLKFNNESGTQKQEKSHQQLSVTNQQD